MKIIEVVDNFMMKALDLLALVLWNQFSIERIWIARVAFAAYIGASFTSFFIVDGPPSNFWMSTLFTLFLVIALMIFGLQLFVSELIARLASKSQQNAKAANLRTDGHHTFYRVFVWITFWLVCGPMLFFKNYDGFIVNLIGWLGLFLLMVVNAIFVSEDPPKRFKLKLPKIEFNFNPPVPSPA